MKDKTLLETAISKSIVVESETNHGNEYIRVSKEQAIEWLEFTEEIKKDNKYLDVLLKNTTELISKIKNKNK